MTETRILDSAPSMVPLMLKAAFGAIPGTHLLPVIGPDRGDDVPDIAYEMPSVTVDRERLEQYCRVCGFTPSDTLPPTYPQIAATALHMAMMTNGRFPFPAIGVVHIENLIRQQRPINADETLELRVSSSKLEPHPKGRKFTFFTEVRVDGEVVWSAESVTLSRGKGGGESSADAGAAAKFPDATTVDAAAEWELPSDQGRRYAAVSGDRNPIHLYDITAKPLGFQRAIIHGMWTKARALAQLEDSLPEALETAVRFKRPILLPAKVTFGREDRKAGEIGFGVRDAKKGEPHLEGYVKPI